MCLQAERILWGDVFACHPSQIDRLEDSARTVRIYSGHVSPSSTFCSVILSVLCRNVQYSNPCVCRNAFHWLSPLCSDRRGLTNGTLVSFDYTYGTRGRGSDSVSERLLSTSYLLPFAVDQGKLQVIFLYGFIRPTHREDRFFFL